MKKYLLTVLGLVLLIFLSACDKNANKKISLADMVI